MNWLSMVKSLRLLAASFILIIPSLSSCNRLFVNSDALHLQAAEDYSREKNYKKAIEEYQAHIRYRLSIEDRPEWENPHFYLVLIGDLELLQDRPDDALTNYQEAEKTGVDPNLISDRYRSLAHWYEQRGDLDRAVSLLKSRREKDPILIDSMLDRLSKAIVAKERNSELLPDPTIKAPAKIKEPY